MAFSWHLLATRDQPIGQLPKRRDFPVLAKVDSHDLILLHHEYHTVMGTFVQASIDFPDFNDQDIRYTMVCLPRERSEPRSSKNLGVTKNT